MPTPFSTSIGEANYRDTVVSSVKLAPLGQKYLPEGTQTIARIVLEVGVHPWGLWDCQTVTADWIPGFSVIYPGLTPSRSE